MTFYSIPNQAIKIKINFYSVPDQYRNLDYDYITSNFIFFLKRNATSNYDLYLFRLDKPCDIFKPVTIENLNRVPDIEPICLRENIFYKKGFQHFKYEKYVYDCQIKQNLFGYFDLMSNMDDILVVVETDIFKKIELYLIDSLWLGDLPLKDYENVNLNL